MNKKLLSLFTFLLVVTSGTHTAFAIAQPTPSARMMSPEAFCSLDAVKLSRGSKGDNVEKYQKLLDYYYSTSVGGNYIEPTWKIDGVFGKVTENRTKTFQLFTKVKQDGIVGKKTRAALNNWCMKNYNVGGPVGSDNPYVKKVSLGDEFTVKPNSSFTINDTAVVVSVSQIYGNKCSANAAFGPDVVCTMEYNPAIRFTGMFGGDVSISFTPQTLYVGETSNFSLQGFTDKTDATLKLVSVSDDGTSVKLKLEKK